MRERATTASIAALVALCAVGPLKDRAKHRRALRSALQADGLRPGSARKTAEQFIAEHRRKGSKQA